MSAAELRKAHALADAGDESIGRYPRRVTSDYERRFGDALPPEVALKPGPGKRTKS